MNVSEFKIIYKKFSDVEDLKIQHYLDFFSSFRKQKFWKDKYDIAQGLWTAHMLECDIAYEENGAGVILGERSVSSERIGDVSVSYANQKFIDDMDLNDSSLMATLYGRRFLMLKREMSPPCILLKR